MEDFFKKVIILKINGNIIYTNEKLKEEIMKRSDKNARNSKKKRNKMVL